MDEVIPHLWVGDMASALDSEGLKAHDISSILSAMRGRVSIHPTFIRHQIMLDDVDSADALAHFPACIKFIEKELDQQRGVLVHCQAGMSRSATIVAAYLMYARGLDADAALDIIRQARPSIQPNAGFLRQLQIFYMASYNVSRHNKTTRMYYLERAMEEIMNGDGSFPEDNMFAKFPRSPSDSTPNTPINPPRRRIRCKMCRQELAAREHMMDHGQVGPETPALSLTPAVSRRPSMHDPSSGSRPPSRRSSSTDNPLFALNPLSRRPSTNDPTRPRLPSVSEGKEEKRPASEGSEKMTSISGNERKPRRASLLGLGGRGGFLSDSLSMSALETDDEDVESTGKSNKNRPLTSPSKSLMGNGLTPSMTLADVKTPVDLTSVVPEGKSLTVTDTGAAPYFAAATDLAAQLHPKLAALRSNSISTLAMSPLQPQPKTSPPIISAFSPPLLTNTTCSGYFVEPMKWMEPFLKEGQLGGKITCPNKKCNTKIGNYDWAGVCCSCSEWVVPGFCIHRSKVDEVVV